MGKKAANRQNKIHDRLLSEIDEGLQAEADYMAWYIQALSIVNNPDNQDPPTPPTIDAHYTDTAQLRTWRQERG